MFFRIIDIVRQFMQKSSPEVMQLRLDVEKRFGGRLCSPSDFDMLSMEVWNKTHDNLSSSTLKRLWGYVDSGETVHRTTLTILTRYLGYADWDDYLSYLAFTGGVESHSFPGEGIRVDDLHVGDRLLLSWLPNRKCVVRYLGDLSFVVEQQENSKLLPGDRFDAAFFFVGQPMYLDRLVRCNMPTTSYVAGSKHGLHSVEIL